MASDSSSPTNNTNSNDMSRQQRRGSVASTPLTNLFRSNSISQPAVTGFPIPIPTAGMDQRRRLSVSTFGLSGTSPTTPSSILRRASLSTNDSIDESAIEDDDARTTPSTSFTRRMSFGTSQAAMRGGVRGGVSPGTTGKEPQTSTTPGTRSDLCSPRSDQGFNWSEQLRSRAESTVAQSARPSFSFASGLSASPPRGVPPTANPSFSPRHDRAKSVSDMPAPPAQQPPRARVPQKPDHFQERILKGDFYMD
ncbi:hypothetical protein QBC38DRAFT_117491 [Podospora fimiseda]|uniref:Uncharacterized protein n=1 Tax=Podospora fimiseda TaxID=252190 RepID=A0AAN7BGK3_9PEZI|nr:hypothetical protein QBC38DRAFT_117491 [Podospora fimiseda]